VIANLVSNAIKFTAGGEVVVRASASPAGARAAVVRIEVSDTGIGIEPAALGRLFQPFSQADNSTTRKFGGTGLGRGDLRRSRRPRLAPACGCAGRRRERRR